MKRIKISLIFSFFITGLISIHVCHSQIVSVNSVKANDGIMTGETAIAISPTDNDSLLIVYNNLKSVSRYPGYAFSGDGGSTWPDTGSISFPGVDPSCAFNDSGVAFYAFIKYNPARPYVAKRMQDGTWDTTRVSSLSADKSYMTVDNNGDGKRDGYIYVAWTTNQMLMFSHSTNGGTSFETPADTIDIPPADKAAVGVVPVVGKNSDVYLTWIRTWINTEDSVVVYFIKSEEDSISFNRNSIQEIAVIDSGMALAGTVGFPYCGMRLWSFPTIAVDVSQTGGDYIYVAYTQRESVGSEYFDIYYVESTNGGSTWFYPSAAVDYSSSKEFLPWLTVTPQGKFCLAFATNLHCSGSCADLYLAHGSNMSSLDTLSLTSNCEVSGSGYYDYVGITSTDGFAYPCWTQKTASDSGVYWAIVDFPPVQPTGVAAGPGLDYFVAIIWDANPEDDIDYYEIWRYLNFGKDHQGPWTKIDTTSDTTYFDYGWDPGPDGEGTAKYKIRAKDDAGQYSPYSSETDTIRGDENVSKIVAAGMTPSEFSLSQNFPNPFNPETDVSFALPTDASVILRIYDILGREIALLVDGSKEAGYHTVTWNGKNNQGAQVASGIYFYRLTAGEFMETKSMLLLK